MYLLVVSYRAQKRIESVSDYILEEWGLKAHRRFVAELERCFRVIETNPKAFRCNIDRPEIHECVVSPYNIMYYLVDGLQVVILSLEDTRMLPVNIHSL